MHYKTLFKFGAWALTATGVIHLMSFLNNREPSNDSERQLMDLMANYRFDLGMGITRSMEELVNFFSLSLSLLCFFAGLLGILLSAFFENTALARKVVPFYAIFWTLYLVPLYLLTFLPPQVCFTVAWLGFAGAWWRLGK